MTALRQKSTADAPRTELDEALEALDKAKHDWARVPAADRLLILDQVKDALLPVTEEWAATAARAKQIPADSPLVGEEWLSGPYALMAGCNGLMETLSQLEDKAFLSHLPSRKLPNGQLALRVMPHSIWDRLLLSGVHADVWMQPGVSNANLAEHAASLYDTPPRERRGKVALILGAGNIASIAPLDVFQKLFLENQVCILKMNPVNDYLTPFLEAALAPLIERNALRIVKGDGAAGAYLTDHPLVEEMHITGSQATHDAIVWGTGEEGVRNRAAGTPRNSKRITSELGAVCPTIVVPGPWSKADIRFQAEHLATQKLHNSGFNCIACQVLITQRGWEHGPALIEATEKIMARSTRPAYYPGADDRLADFAAQSENPTRIERGDAPPLIVTDTEDTDYFRQTEVFAPAMSRTELHAKDAEDFLRRAIIFANERLHGTLGANIIIHPKTIKAIGRQRLTEIIAELRYGTIAINAWTGLGFLLAPCPWGAFPGHTLTDVQSGIGTVHNSFMLEKTERVVVEAPFRPFPRSLLGGKPTLLPRPPWFITNRRQDRLGELLVDFQHSPGWRKLPRIFLNALRG
ncbi:aldehyde dehydrogenase family protein [Paracoccus saliphilus]|uniref:Aldehyde dehydrogenase n=1 Tax=Paracoccus saliphilus TaxID=405559 RepID=A0AA45W1F9_9RHOB|nr:aldehyde dehydrogenase family protein [Paracoccus saliphilus]WCR03622.1 aldehyde dehydrogenase [Paracoccus saliphilus]SIS56811.1 aldehyde dehydrogenase (NAD(P)+) [Paracoccus saliphilus]